MARLGFGHYSDYYRIFTDPHYQQRKELLEAIALLPDRASVLTHDHISLHIPQRKAGNLTLYFSTDYGGEYILCSFAPYFLDTLTSDATRRRFMLYVSSQLKKYIDSPAFATIYHQKDVWLLKRINSHS